jgi:CheY-like chemotaxis protein
MSSQDGHAEDRTMGVASGASPGPAGSEQAAAPALVLLVEGQPDIRSLLSEYLLSRGVVPVPAAGSAHAEVVCETLAPDLVLIDLPLPDTDGEAFVRWIKARRPDVSIAVCIQPDPVREARYRAEGADEIIAKPLDLVGLDRALGRIASGSRPA